MGTQSLPLSAINTAESFAKVANVSRETLQGYEAWEKLLSHWNKSINLVQKETLEQFWSRHALDSAQICAHIPSGTTRCLDLGAGAGFPGLAVAMALQDRAGAHVDLVESNGKKCSFLRAVIRELRLPAKAVQERAEQREPQIYDMISARAFAPLPRLLDYAAPFWGSQTAGVFLKGRQYQSEIESARLEYNFDAQIFDSQSDDEGKILVITNLSTRTSDEASIQNATVGKG